MLPYKIFVESPNPNTWTLEAVEIFADNENLAIYQLEKLVNAISCVTGFSYTQSNKFTNGFTMITGKGLINFSLQKP